MACFHPLKAYRSTERNPSTGKYGIAFSATKGLIEGSSFALPCGRCIGCRLDKAKTWAIRCYHEGRMHADSLMLTLTYDQQSVPQDHSLKLRDWQLFMKRLRQRTGTPIRFYACGEYGPKTFRPHYHALIFGWWPRDARYVRKNEHGDRMFTSELLRAVWPLGDHEFTQLTYKSANYVTRYVVQKMRGDKADDHYTRVSPIDGNTYRVATEFSVMSRRPGIGTAWFEKFKTDAFPSDFLIVDGKRVKPPAFYLKKLEEAEQEIIKRERKRYAVQPRQKANNTKERLAVREEVQRLRAKRLLRKLES